jgi:RND family efflux transporter MFP subunit
MALENAAEPRDVLGELAGKWRALNESGAEPNVFWTKLLDAMSATAGAAAGCLVLREASGSWRRFAAWPAGAAMTREAASFAQHLTPLVERAAQDQTAVAALPAENATAASAMAAVRLNTGRDADICVAAFLFEGSTEGEAAERMRRLLPVADAPARFQERHLLLQARADAERFSSVLDVLVAMSQPRRFVAVAMVFCNELAARHKCERVSLGWLEHGRYIRLQAISHTESFERKMELVKSMEFAMEEALDQDDEILWPAPAGGSHIVRDHEALGQSEASGFICSLPIRVEGKAAGVVMLERKQGAFGEAELKLLRLTSDLVARRLDDVKRRDVWFGARCARALRENAAKLVGVEHTWAKVLGASVALALGILFFGRSHYRVESPFILKPEQVVHVPAPFDGYIEDVSARVGDTVRGGDVLLKLDTRDLLLEEAAALADRERYVREAEKARAEDALADMRIATALADEAKARLDLVRYRLAQSALKAPFDGVVAEGDLRERIGSPVSKGDPLFRVARLEDMYVQCEVPEEEIHEIRPGAEGRIAFASEPRLKFPVRVARVDPVAQPKEGRNMFTVRCELTESPRDWWRPGMSGVAKIGAGRRNTFWILTHKTTDFLRMTLWW